MTTKRQWYERGILKLHTVVYHCVDHTFYEVRGKEEWSLRGEYFGHLIDTENGEVTSFQTSLMRCDLEPIAPTHPVYLKWAARRLADTLEGLDR